VILIYIIVLFGTLSIFLIENQEQTLAQPSKVEQQELTKLFGETFTNEVLSKCDITDECTIVEYSSPNIVVLHGDIYLYNQTDTGRSSNPFLWRAVNTLEANGFVIDSVGIAGEGSKNLPNRYHIIMLKQ
jgi:hypothetical protein